MTSNNLSPTGSDKPVTIWQALLGKPVRTPESSAEERVREYAAEAFAQAMFERIDGKALADAVVESAEEEFGAFERMNNLAGDSEVKRTLAGPKLQMLANKNNQRINRRFQ